MYSAAILTHLLAYASGGHKKARILYRSRCIGGHLSMSPGGTFLCYKNGRKSSRDRNIGGAILKFDEIVVIGAALFYVTIAGSDCPV